MTRTGTPCSLSVTSDLLLPLLVVVDERAGGVQDRLRAAVVLRQRDDAGVREVALEVEDVLDVRTPPLVNRLVRVADHAEVRVIDGQALGDLVLGEVGVLVLVDQHVLEAGVEFGAEFLVVLEGHRGEVEQVVEVHRVGAGGAASRSRGRPSRRSA